MAGAPRPIVVDPYRSFVFPNRVRELRSRHGFPKLLALASALPEIPYIRLSKIERGEVVARADEIIRIAGLLGVAPRELLVDVDDDDFDMETWSKPFREGKAADEAEEEFAILLGAAMRARRANSAYLTIAAIDRDYGIPPVVLSRIENALKTVDRWNHATLHAICRLFNVADERALRLAIGEQYQQGLLDDYVGIVADPEARLQKTRKLITQLREDLEAADVPTIQRPPRMDPFAAILARQHSRAQTGESAAPVRNEAPAAVPRGPRRMLTVMGAPLAGGLILPTETTQRVEAPPAAGPRAFALRICRPTLGVGLPGHAVIVADPDVFPTSGGLAVLREQGNYRLLAISFDLHGAMIGHSINPRLEVPLDEADPGDLAAVVCAYFG